MEDRYAPQVTAAQVSAVFWRRGAAEPEGSQWHYLGDAGAENDAGPNDYILIELTYPHKLLLGSLSAPFFGATSNGTVNLAARAQAVRN